MCTTLPCPSLGEAVAFDAAMRPVNHTSTYLYSICVCSGPSPGASAHAKGNRPMMDEMLPDYTPEGDELPAGKAR